MQKRIIVLGMHRSGTSLVAEAVHKWGAFGNDEFLPTDYRNPQGYWEYAPLVHFNRRLMVSAGSQS
ncbi:MAG TPA: sulfotransferase family protein, partial [Terriglobia bacterium]|nr:sulfotransferase family protein [Terriglobia bacterium]